MCVCVCVCVCAFIYIYIYIYVYILKPKTPEVPFSTYYHYIHHTMYPHASTIFTFNFLRALKYTSTLYIHLSYQIHSKLFYNSICTTHQQIIYNY